MSHYVFLSASPLGRMPDGSRGEWRGFREACGVELEAKNGPPLFWWCLFGPEDLRWARLVDDFDEGDLEGERELFLEEAGSGAEAAYPYLVTGQEAALRRLEQRRAAILASIGRGHAALYDAFAGLIGREFGPFLLLRTSGLPDPPALEGWLCRTAAEMGALKAGEPAGPDVAGMFAGFRQWERDDPVWRLSGAGPAGLWPPPTLAAAYPARGASGDVPGAGPGAGPGAEPGDRPVPGRGGGAPGRWNSLWEWIAALAAAGAGLGAWWLGGSVLAGLAAFVAVAALGIWLLVRQD